jgi:hypothetical protein
VQARLLGSIKEDGVMPFAYPAFVALLFVPFSVLPYPAAYLLMLGCNLFLLGLLIRIMAKGLSLQEHQIALLATFAYCARRSLQPADGLAMVRADAD